jgi:hypothetical protein
MSSTQNLLDGDAARFSPTVMRTERRSKERRDFRSPSLPAGHRHLHQGAAADVVGASRTALEKVVGQHPEGHADIVDAAMVWEPENHHDSNAIAIQIGGETCGYLTRPAAAAYRPVMERCRALDFVPVVRGDISGRSRKDDGSWADFSLRLYVAPPDRLLGGVLQVAAEHPRSAPI